MKKRHKLLAAAAGVAAIGIYRAVKGRGAFNKIRFAEQHEAVGKYMDAHHPGAVYSAIESLGDGWSCVINDNGERYLLYITCSEDGVFIFDESEI
jgi:hypothetical protein